MTLAQLKLQCDGTTKYFEMCGENEVKDDTESSRSNIENNYGNPDQQLSSELSYGSKSKQVSDSNKHLLLDNNSTCDVFSTETLIQKSSQQLKRRTFCLSTGAMKHKYLIVSANQENLLTIKGIKHPTNDEYAGVVQYGNFAIETNNGTILVPMIYITDWNEEIKSTSSNNEFTGRRNDDNEECPSLWQCVKSIVINGEQNLWDVINGAMRKMIMKVFDTYK